MIPETNEILKTGLGGSKPYLGSPAVVQKILHEYLFDLIAFRTAQIEDGEDPMPKVRAAAQSLQDIFYGQDQRYLAFGWNCEGSLGAFLVNECDIGGDTSDAVRRVGARIAKEFYADLVANENDDLSDEHLEREVDALVMKYTPILAGFGEAVEHEFNQPDELAKAHVKGYSKKDGTYVKPHERTDGRTPHPAVPHPKADDNGKPVLIKRPHHESAPSTWHNPDAIATFVPNGNVPLSLNGVPIREWRDHPVDNEEWEYCDGVNDNLTEPPFPVPANKKPSAGVVIEEPDGRVWVVHPTNGFGGYHTTWPKGTVEPGMSLQASAVKECFEETGLQVEITGFLGDYDRTTSKARIYTAKRVGGSPVAGGWESQAVSLVPRDKLMDLLNMNTDHGIAEAIGAKK